MLNFYIKTYGCQMNERDSDSAAAILEENGYHAVDSEEDADIVILNTCSVRDQAERKAIGKLWIIKSLKEKRPHMIFGIMGCMAQSRGEELLQTIPHLDFAIGTDQIHQLPEVIGAILEGERKIDRDERSGPDTPGIDVHRLDESGRHFSAFVSIMRGCNRYCSYCIVPYVRGPERSRDPQGIVDEVRSLAERGVCEVMLLGQNVAAYGLDGSVPPPPEDCSPFADLLARLQEIEGIRRIRFTSPHPAFFNRRLIHAIAELPKVCKNVHLPLQSGSDRILKLMNRPYTAEKYRDIVGNLKSLIPDITFSTDVIVGFPTETEEDFQMTRDLMNEVGFDNSYIFKYSPRKGTVSARMEDDVPQEEKERRNQILLKDLEDRLAVRNESLVGKTFEILLDGPSKRNPNRWSGRTDGFKLAVFEPKTALKPGDFIQVRIIRSTSMTLYGEQVIEA